MKHQLNLTHRWTPIAFAGLLALMPGMATASSVLAEISGSPDDYESERQSYTDGTSPSTSSGAGTAESLSVSSVMLVPNFVMDESRPVFQFDLSTLAGVDPATNIVQSATLRLSLLSASAAPEFALEAWGRNGNLPGPIPAGAGNAGAQFASNTYSRADQAGLGGLAAPASLEIDVTNFMQARYDEYLGGGDSWVLFRLQPDAAPSIAVNPNTSYEFASANHSIVDLRPGLDLALVPEPAVAVLALAGVGFFAARRRVPVHSSGANGTHVAASL